MKLKNNRKQVRGKDVKINKIKTHTLNLIDPK